MSRAGSLDVGPGLWGERPAWVRAAQTARVGSHERRSEAPGRSPHVAASKPRPHVQAAPRGWEDATDCEAVPLRTLLGSTHRVPTLQANLRRVAPR